MIARAVVLFGCFVIGAAAIARSSRAEPTPLRTSLSLLPLTMGEWRGVHQTSFDAKTLKVLGVDDYLTRGYYRSAQSGVDLYIGYYRSQREGETIHSPLNCLPGSGWEPLSKTTLHIPVPTDLSRTVTAQIPVNRFLIQKGLEQKLVFYWYQSHGRAVASEYVSRFYLMADALRLNRTDGALVRVISPVLPESNHEQEPAQQDATQFIAVLFPRLADYLPL